MPLALSSAGNGVAFLVSAEAVYQALSAACSSPQTTELNADTRAPTLMKWVNIGMAQAAFLVIVAATVDRQHRGAIIGGGAIAGTFMYVSYIHAKKAGLGDGKPGTEG